jgi:S-adenosylmethionine:tRNA ribosyltransferase-isomerase
MDTVRILDPHDGLRLEDYDYPLPESLIARYPLEKRDESRMLVTNRNTGALAHRRFFELPELLAPGDLVVLNNTRVLPSRFFGQRRGRTGWVEILLLYPAESGDPCHWRVMMRPAKKLKPGTVVELPGTTSIIEILSYQNRGRGEVRVHLDDFDSVEALMASVGHMPLPPYLNREAEPADRETYQTVYARVPGAQAAPTAGLHFTPEVLQRLADRGIQTAEVTLAVSSGTFRSVQMEDITEHEMDPEHYTLPPETVKAVLETRERGGRVVAVGTTVAKTLETVAAENHGDLVPESAWSRLFIYPGFRFQAVDGLLTNFHLPKTTLLMLVSAFSSRKVILDAYAQAVAKDYRFYSYGDCMLLI